MFCGLVVLSACGGAASGSAASSDTPLGRVPAIFVEVAAKKKRWMKACAKRMI